MVAILKIAAWHTHTRTHALYSTPTRPAKMDSIGQGVLLEIDGNQFKDGCHGGHIENRSAPIFERNLLYSTPTYPAKMDLIGQGVLLKIDGNQKLTDARTDARTTPVMTIPLSPIRAEG